MILANPNDMIKNISKKSTVEFHSEWNDIISSNDDERTVRAIEFARSLPKEGRRHLLFHLPALFKNGDTNLVVNVYEALGMMSVGAYYRSKALALGINAANNGAALYIYHMKRGHKALAMSYLLIGARRSDPEEKALLLRNVVAKMDESGWGSYYKEKVLREHRAAETKVLASADRVT